MSALLPGDSHHGRHESWLASTIMRLGISITRCTSPTGPWNAPTPRADLTCDELDSFSPRREPRIRGLKFSFELLLACIHNAIKSYRGRVRVSLSTPFREVHVRNLCGAAPRGTTAAERKYIAGLQYIAALDQLQGLVITAVDMYRLLLQVAAWPEIRYGMHLAEIIPAGDEPISAPGFFNV